MGSSRIEFCRCVHERATAGQTRPGTLNGFRTTSSVSNARLTGAMQKRQQARSNL